MFDLFSDPVKVAQQLEIIRAEFGFATWETLYSLLLEVVFAYLIGLPLGVLLVTGEKEGIRPLPGWLMWKPPSPWAHPPGRSSPR